MEKIKKILRVLFIVGLIYGSTLGVAWIIGQSEAVNSVLDFSKSTAFISVSLVALLGLIVKVTLDGFVRLLKWLGIGSMVIVIAGLVTWGVLSILGYGVFLDYIARIVLVGVCSLMFFVLVVGAYETLLNAKVIKIKSIVTVAFSVVIGVGFLTTGQMLNSYSAAVGDNFSLAGMDGVFDSALMNISGDTEEGFVVIDQEKFQLSFINYVYEVATGQETTVQTEGAQALFTLDSIIGMVQTNEMNLDATRLDLNVTIEDVAALEVAFADNATAISANSDIITVNTAAISAAEIVRNNNIDAIAVLQAQAAANLALIEGSTDAGEIAALQLEQQTLETALAQAEADLLAVNANLAVLQAELDAAEAALAQAEADLLALSNELATVKTTLESADAALQAQYDALNTEVQALTGGTVDLSAYSTTEEMNAAIQTAIDGISAGSGGLSDLVEKSLFPFLITSAYSSNGSVSYMISSSPENYYSNAEAIGYNSAVILDILNILKDDLYPRVNTLEGGA